MISNVANKLKRAAVPVGSVVRTIPLGAFKGLRRQIDFNVNSQLYLGLWERETYAVIHEGLAQADWCIDVGAGFGELAVMFAKQPRISHIIAIEPNYGELGGLAAVMKLNNIPQDRIAVIPSCAGTALTFVALDSLAIPAGQRGFIKIDVDGGEVDVLRSASRLLDATGVHLLIETHSAALESDCISYLETKGYHCRILKNAWWRAMIPEKRPVEHNRWLSAKKLTPH